MSFLSQLLNSRSSDRGLHIHSRRASNRRLHIESLEKRWMLTTTATHFAVLTPTSVTPSEAFDVTVQALDQFNNLVANYTGPVHFSSSDNAAMVPADTTQTTGTGGFVAILNTVGSQTISVVDTLN